MRKFLIVIGVLFIILAVLTEIVLPQILSGMLKEKISQLTYSQEVDLSIDSSPRFLITTGQVDEIHGEVVNGRIGELETTDLRLNGEQIKVDMPMLLFGDKKDENGRTRRVEDYLKSVGKVEMIGVISEENLKKFLEQKVAGKLENLQLKITPEEINATANVMIMNRNADLELSGLIIADEGDLYFRMTKLNARAPLLRHVQLDRFFGDIKIASADKLPLNLKFENVELQEGQAILTAIRN
ncbi:MAG: LmeA family phospholipid-binding protein [Selenomonadaceae bacterium]|nr:LmeA family phospholipid-binding protein [Selenomonadaceae bacterium]